MAFTNAQKVQIRLYMGWENRFFAWNNQLEYAIGAIENDADATAIVVDILDKLADIDAQLIDSNRRIKAEEIGSIVLPGHMEIKALRSQGRMFVGRISSLLGCPIHMDVYAGSAQMAKSNLLTIAN